MTSDGSVRALGRRRPGWSRKTFTETLLVFLFAIVKSKSTLSTTTSLSGSATAADGGATATDSVSVKITR